MTSNSSSSPILLYMFFVGMTLQFLMLTRFLGHSLVHAIDDSGREQNATS